MTRMLEALRRLEAANLLVTPAAPVVPTSPPAIEQLATLAASLEPSVALLDEPPLEATAVLCAPASICLVDLDEPPFEPTFGPLVSWDRPDESFGYASHAIDDALDAFDVLDALADETAESISPPQLATLPAAVSDKEAPAPLAPEVPATPSALDEFDPAEVLREHEGENIGHVTMVGLSDAPAVAADVLSTIQFAEHWATIALDEFGIHDVAEHAAPAAEFALADESLVVVPVVAETVVVELEVREVPATSTSALAEADPATDVAAVNVEEDEGPEHPPAEAPPTPAISVAETETPPTSPKSDPPQVQVTKPAQEEIVRPSPSPAELAAMLDLSDATLLAQYTRLGERIVADLKSTTKTCAALVSVEHQPHVTDVALRTAIVLCRSGKQVLMIDAALGDKQLTAGLGMPVEFGLSEVLKGRVAWQQAVRATATPGLCVLPAGRLTPPRLSPEDNRLKDVLKELTSQWDLVLLDGGSLAESSARYVAAAARNVYLVVRLGETAADAAEQAAASLSSPDVALRGCIVTNA